MIMNHGTFLIWIEKKNTPASERGIPFVCLCAELFVESL